MKIKLQLDYSNKHKTITIFGFAVCTLGITLLFLRIWIMEILTTSLIVLKPNSLIEEFWQKVSDLDTAIYIFNWENPEHFYNSSIKPKFKQVGPYRFTQEIEKINVVWNNNNTVTYNQQRRFNFNERKSSNLSEEINTVNLVTLCLAHILRNENYLVKRFFSMYVNSAEQNVNITTTTRKLLYDGLDDLALDVAKYIPFVLPSIPRFDKFSLLTVFNDSKLLEGVFNIENGATSGLFEVRNWNFLNTTPYFDAPCAKVHGSPGEIYSMDVAKQYVGIFAAAICRHIKFDFEEEVMVDGIVGYKYSVGKQMLDNGTLIPGNECYCGGDCVPSGMMSMSSCRYNLPFFLSLPHYYRADAVYLDAVEGIHPKKEEHEAYIIVEPTTGILLNTSINVQLNARIHTIEDISLYENARDLFFPVLWYSQKAALPKTFRLLLKIYIIFPHILTGIASILITLGLIFLYVPYKAVLISWFRKLTPKKRHISPMPEEIPLRSCD